MSKTISFVIIFTVFLACLNAQEKTDFNIEDVGKKSTIIQTVSVDNLKSVIEKNEYTLFFFYTTWCGASQVNFKNYVKPALDTMDLNKLTFVIVGLGNSKDKIRDIMQKNQINIVSYYLKDSKGVALFDKRQINKTLKEIFENFESVDYVPVSVLCNRDFSFVKVDGIGSLLYDFSKMEK